MGVPIMDYDCFKLKLGRFSEQFGEKKAELELFVKALFDQNEELRRELDACDPRGFDAERANHELYKRNAVRKIVVLSLVVAVEPLVISENIIERAGVSLGVSTTKAAVEATALRDAAKFVREVANMEGGVVEDIKKSALRGRENDSCVMTGARVVAKILKKVEERLEDKAADVVADRLVEGASPAAAPD